MEPSKLLPLINDSLAIAYGYLERAGVDDREHASRLIIRSIQLQMRKGERRPLMLANRAIETYQQNGQKTVLEAEAQA